MPLRRLSLPFDALMLAFALSAGLGLLVAYDRALGFNTLLAVFVSAGVYWAAAHLIRSWERARHFSLLVVGAGLIYTLVFILLYDYQNYIEMPDLILRLGTLTTALPAFPVHIHPNSAATAATGVLPLAVTLALSTRHGEGRALWWMGIAALAYGLLLTFSRGAFIALALTLLLALAALVLPRWAALVLLALVALGAAVALVGGGPTLERAFAWAYSRYELYRNSLYLAKDYAFTGVGLGEAFAMVYSRFGLLIQVPFLVHPHNLPLAVWMGHGLLGVAALTGLIMIFYLYVRKVTRCAQPRWLFHGAWLGVTTTLIHGLFDAQQYSTEGVIVMPFLFALIGLTVASGRLALHKVYWQEHGFSLRYIPRALPAVGALLLIGAGAAFGSLIAAAWKTNLGALAETRGALAAELSAAERLALYDEAARHYSAALALAPKWASASRRLGNLDVTLGQYDAAVPLLEAAAAAEPDNPAAIKGLGLAYTWTGRVAEAAAAFNRLDDPAAMASELSTWGYYRRDQGQPLLAAYAWDAMWAMKPDAASVEALLLIAEAYREGGDLIQARLCYNHVLEVEPDNETARQALAALG